MTSSPGPSCDQTWLNAFLEVLLIISVQTCAVTSMEAATAAHITAQNNG